MEKRDVQTGSTVAIDEGTGDGRCFIRRVVQNLNLEPVPRIVQPNDRLDQPLDDVSLVVDRQLHRDPREMLVRGIPCLPDLFVVLQHPCSCAALQEDHNVAIDPIEKETKEGTEVYEQQDHDRNV